MAAKKDPKDKASLGNLGGEISRVESIYFRTRLAPYNPDDLVGKKGLTIYRDISKDEQVKACLYAKMFSVLSSGWEIQRPKTEKDQKVNETLLDELVRFANFNLKEMAGKADNKNTFPWIQSRFDSKLLDIMSALIFGFSLSEKVGWIIEYGEFEGKVGLKNLKTRMPYDIEFDTDEFGNLKSNGILQGKQAMPQEKFVVWSYRPSFGNMYGNSDLREVYKNWWYKQQLERFMLMTLERYGQPMISFTYEGTITQAQRNTLNDFGKNLQQNQSITLPKNIVMEVHSAPTNTADAFIPAINMQDDHIRTALLVPKHTGQSASDEAAGSYARSETEFENYMLTIEQTRNDIECVVDEQILKPLIDLNWEVEDGLYPCFKFKTITEEHRQKLFTLWKEATTSKALSKTREDEAKARELIDWIPLPEEAPVAMETTEAVQMDPFTGQPIGLPVPKADGVNTDPPPFKKKDDKDKKEFRRYAKSEYEQRCDFALIESIYDKDAVGVDLRLRELLSKTRDEYSDRAESLLKRGITPEQAVAFKIDSGLAVQVAVNDYLRSVWTKARDAALNELPNSVRRKTRTFARVSFEPVEALNYLKARALHIKGLIDDALTSQTKNILFQHLAGGRSVLESIADLRQLFEPYIGDPSKIQPSGQVGIGFPPGTKAPENLLMAYRLENILRTETSGAIAQGRMTIGDDAGDYVLGYELSPILDERTSPVCKKIGDTDGGLIVRKDAPQMARLQSPLHWQCRTTPVFVTREDAPIDWATEAELNAVIELIPRGFK